jgi:PBSX family phage terminase large subunit
VNLDAVLSALSRQQIYSIVESTAPINLWEGSVRSGKTIASIVRWFHFLHDPPPDGELVMIGKTRDTVYRNVIEPMTKVNLFGPAAHQVDYTPGAQSAMILGRRVHIIGANDAKAEPKVRGLTVAGAYVDEATVLPKSFFDQLVARCSVKDARIFATTNPDTTTHWLRKDYMLRAAEVGLRAWHFTLDDNPHLPPEYVARLKRTYTGLWYKRFIQGLWVLAEGAIYEAFDETKHVVTDEDMPTLVEVLACGIDYGTTNPFHAVMLALGDDGRLYATAEWRYASKQERKALTDAEYSKRLGEWLDGQRLKPRFLVVDPSAASFKEQLRQDLRPAKPGNNDVIDGIRDVSSLFATDKLRIHESCKGLLEELPSYTWDPDKAEKGEDAPIKLDDHGLDALRYAIHTTRRLWRPYVQGGV